MIRIKPRKPAAPVSSPQYKNIMGLTALTIVKVGLQLEHKEMLNLVLYVPIPVFVDEMLHAFTDLALIRVLHVPKVNTLVGG